MNRFYKESSKYPSFKVRGISGTNLNYGSISGYEHNSELTGSRWVTEAEEMLRTDAIVQRSWHMLKQTLLSASWRFTAGLEGNKQSEELADFMNEAYGFDGYSGQMLCSFEEQLGYLLEFVPIGYRYAEELYRVGPDSKGRVRVWLKEYADREPSAHSDWVSLNGSTLDAVTQTQTNFYQRPEPIPSEKLLLLTLNKTGSNWEGVGRLRSCWWWWRQKQRISNLMCVAVDRWAIPTPKVKVDRSMGEQQGLTDSDIDAMIDDAEEQIQSFISAEQQYLVENPVISFDSYSVDPNLQSGGPLAIITECDNQISQAFLAQFANLGVTDTGSRSVGEIHMSLFRRSAINYADIVTSSINGVDRPGGGTVGRLIKWNFGAVDPSLLPKLTHSGLDNDDLAESLGMIPGLIQSGAVTPDDTLERDIRDKLGLQELSLDRSVDERETASVYSSAQALTEQILRRRDEKS